LAKSSFVTLEVYNSLGQKIITLVNTKMNPGHHELKFEANNLPSGVYYYQLVAGEFNQVKKMILLK
jgi:hypothetical protein